MLWRDRIFRHWDRKTVQKVWENLAIIAALTFTTSYSALTWMEMEQMIKCGVWTDFFARFAFVCQFGLAFLVVALVNLGTIGHVQHSDAAWNAFLPYMLLAFPVSLTVFVSLHVKIALMLTGHAYCQRNLALLSKGIRQLESVHSGWRIALPNPPMDEESWKSALEHANYDVYETDSRGFQAWFCYMLPMSLFVLFSACFANGKAPTPAPLPYSPPPEPPAAPDPPTATTRRTRSSTKRD